MGDYISHDLSRIVENFVKFGVPKETWADTLIALGLAGAGLAVGSGVLARVMAKSRAGRLPRPNLSDEIPFNFIDEDGVTVDSDRTGGFSVIEVEGVSYSNLTDDESDNLKLKRKDWLTRLAQSGVEAMTVTSRRRLAVKGMVNVDNQFLKAVNDRWLNRFSDALVNRNFIVVTGGGGRGEKAKAGREATLEQLDGFNPRVLRHRFDEDGETNSELWDFLSWLINGRGSTVAPYDSADLADALGESEFRFDPKSGLISVHDGRVERFTKVIGLKAVPQSDERFVQQLCRLGCELDIVQWLKPRGSQMSRLALDEKRRNAFMFFGSPIDSKQYEEVDELFAADEDAYCDYEITIFVHGNTVSQLDEGVNEVLRALGRRRFTPVIERTFCEESFLNKWPGRREPLRVWEPTISNVADWTPFEGTARGLDHCGWGPRPFREFRTVTGTPYAFGIHETADREAPGNGIVIGHTGRGKSVLMGFLMSGGLTNFPGSRVIAFDNGVGLRIPTEALGGKMVAPGAQARRERGLLAPLQQADTPENREFLTRLCLEMAECEGPAHEETMSEALSMFMPLPRHERILERFYRECFTKSDPVAIGLKQWFGDGTYAGWFDGDEDVIDVVSSPWVTFNLQRVADNPRLAGVFTSYILHVIKTVVWRTGRPHFIFMDEASSLLAASPLFRKTAEFLFREIRKHRGVFWLALQEGYDSKAHEESFIKNATNYVFLRDVNADANRLKSVYEVSPNGAKFIRNEDEGAVHIKRGVLHVRKTVEGKIETPLDINLDALGEYLNLFRSGDEHVAIQQKFKAEYGEQWVGPYLHGVDQLLESLEPSESSPVRLAAE